jgi:ABC-type branched-subunit amino acid transport system substrate-binding protein
MLRSLGPRENRSRGGQRFCAFAAGLAVMLGFACPLAFAESQTAKIAVALSLTGPNASIGRPDLEGARLAHEIGAGDALLVLGPGTTAMALNEGPIYSDAGIVAIGPTTTGDKVTDPENFFRAIFSTSDAGEILANYLRYDLGGRRAIVLMPLDAVRSGP